MLVRQGLLVQLASERSAITVAVSPEGFAYYDELKRRAGAPLEQLDEDLRRYLEGDAFRTRYPKAYGLWAEAAELLWSAESAAAFTTIGHKAREAMQAFATELVHQHRPPSVEPDPAKTLDRVSAVIKTRRPTAGVARSEFFDALFNYWRAVNRIVQRQEHGAQKEGESLEWEDARRVVFHTAVVMAEIDRSV